MKGIPPRAPVSGRRAFSEIVQSRVLSANPLRGRSHCTNVRWSRCRGEAVDQALVSSLPYYVHSRDAAREIRAAGRRWRSAPHRGGAHAPHQGHRSTFRPANQGWCRPGLLRRQRGNGASLRPGEGFDISVEGGSSSPGAERVTIATELHSHGPCPRRDGAAAAAASPDAEELSIERVRRMAAGPIGIYSQVLLPSYSEGSPRRTTARFTCIARERLAGTRNWRPSLDAGAAAVTGFASALSSRTRSPSCSPRASVWRAARAPSTTHLREERCVEFTTAALPDCGRASRRSARRFRPFVDTRPLSGKEWRTSRLHRDDWRWSVRSREPKEENDEGR